MKTQQQERAKELYFQTNMSKTAIAEQVGVSRKTVLFWSQQGNWDKLRASARNMPSLIAEKCYYLIDQYVQSLLVDGGPNSYSTLHLCHAQTIHLLASTIKKLKNRSTVNESMEMFSFFLEGVNRRDPDLAAQIAPQIEEYIDVRKNSDTTDFLLEDFRQDARLPFPEKEIQESYVDQKEHEELVKEFGEFMQAREAAKQKDAEKPAPADNTATPAVVGNTFYLPGHPATNSAQYRNKDG